MSSTLAPICSNARRASSTTPAPLAGLLGALADDVDGAGGLGLDLGDQVGDRRRRRLRLLGELAHLVGDEREPAAVLARARRLDRGVEREQVGLRGDPGDRLDDAADLVGLRVEPADDLADGLRRGAHGLHRLAGLDGGPGAVGRPARRPRARRGRSPRRPAALRCVAATTSSRMLADARQRLHLALGALGDVAHGARDLARRAAGLVGGRRHLLRRRAEARRGAGRSGRRAG